MQRSKKKKEKRFMICFAVVVFFIKDIMVQGHCSLFLGSIRQEFMVRFTVSLVLNLLSSVLFLETAIHTLLFVELRTVKMTLISLTKLLSICFLITCAAKIWL